jgi:peptide deformylase
MALLEIKKYPDKILKKKTAPVENIDAQTQQLIDDMIETMNAPSGRSCGESDRNLTAIVRY